LCIRDINGLTLHQAFIVLVINLFRALLRTGSTGDTFVHIHETGMLEDVNREVPFLT